MFVTKKRYENMVNEFNQKIKEMEKEHLNDLKQQRKDDEIECKYKCDDLYKIITNKDSEIESLNQKIFNLNIELNKAKDEIIFKDKIVEEKTKSLNSLGGFKANCSKLHKKIELMEEEAKATEEKHKLEIDELNKKINELKSRPTIEQLKREKMLKCDSKKYIDHQNLIDKSKKMRGRGNGHI